jgi:Zn-dependent protease with chaperone function
MSVALLAILPLAALAAPYLLDSNAIRPATGIAIWLSVLLLRAALVVLAVVAAVLYMPGVQPFHLATHWCLHAVVPFFATHLGASGHGIGGTLAALLGLGLVLSAASALLAVLRAARSVRRWLRRGALGDGPGDSVVVGGEDVLVAAAGIRGARIVVSAGALTALDEGELTASLEHERGHIARRHSYIALTGSVASALARALPGSADALRRLHYCLERDADEYAVDRIGDPLALASAICKVALDRPEREPSPVLAGLSGCGAPARLRLLLDRSAARPRPGIDLAARGLVAGVAALVLTAGVLAPGLARAGVASTDGVGAAHHACPD